MNRYNLTGLSSLLRVALAAAVFVMAAQGAVAADRVSSRTETKDGKTYVINYAGDREEHERRYNWFATKGGALAGAKGDAYFLKPARKVKRIDKPDWAKVARPAPDRWYDPHTGDLFETLHTIDCFRMAEQMAGILGKTADAKRYRDIQTRLAVKCNRAEFFDRSKGLYGGGDQGCHALAICLNVAPPPLREKVAQHLIRDIMETRSGHLNTGFLGTWYLLKALTLLNRPDVALRIITNREPPSWATMLKHPDAAPEELTLLPEFFGRGMIPHPGWCSMGFWCYQALGGIAPDPEHPGFERVIIRPQIVRDLTWVKAEYDSIRGTIASHWTLHEEHFTLTVTIPPGTTALVYVPATAPRLVKAPASALVKFQRMEGTHAVFEIAAGTYRFESDLRKSAGCES